MWRRGGRGDPRPLWRRGVRGEPRLSHNRVVAYVGLFAIAAGGYFGAVGASRTGSPHTLVSYAVAPSADGAVSRWHTTLGYGTGSWLPLRAWAGERAYVRFVLPASLDVQKAQLKLCLLAARRTSIEVFATSNTWDEGSLAFTDAPSVGRRIGRALLPGSRGLRCSRIELRSSSLTHRAMASLVVATSDPQRLYLASREQPALAPLLILEGRSVPTLTTTLVGTTVPVPAPARTTTTTAAAPPPASSTVATTTIVATTTTPATTTAPRTTTATTTTTPVTTTSPGTTTTQTGGTVVVAAAGDVACAPADPSFNGGLGTAKTCHERQTAAIVKAINPAVVLGLGDMQYEDGELAKYTAS